MKKILILITVVFIVIGTAGVFFLWNSGSVSPIGSELIITTFTHSGSPTKTVLVQVPFIKKVLENARMSIEAGGETLVDNVPFYSAKDWYTGFYITPTNPLVDGLAVAVTIDNKVYETTVRVESVEVGELLDLASVTDPENATKGFGVSIAHAQGDIEITRDNVPDLTQRIGECAPTAAANSLISLVAEHGGEDLIPGDPLDFIENLKRHMNWTPENGVPPDDFVAGKNRWAAAAGVPIRTTKVGDTQGLTTIDAIRGALENGDAVELRIKLANAAGTKLEGGHMVTVVGIHQDGDQTYIDINDPFTPNSGTEQVEIQQNQIVDYGPWKGITLLSWGFVQTWEGHPTGELLDPMTDEEIQGIQQFVGDDPQITVIEYNGKYLPVSELIVENEEGCGGKHWHAANGVTTATDGTPVPDPGPQCGYGKVSERPSMNISAPQRND